MSKFRVGDWAVFTDKDSTNSLLEIETVSPKLGSPKTVKVGLISRISVSKHRIRHATQEEIKAGKRLP